MPVDSRSARLALCYLCNHLGMMLASGELADLRTLDVTNSELAEHYFLMGYLKHPNLARLPEFLHFPEVVSCVTQMAAVARLKK